MHEKDDNNICHTLYVDVQYDIPVGVVKVYPITFVIILQVILREALEKVDGSKVKYKQASEPILSDEVHYMSVTLSI